MNFIFRNWKTSIMGFVVSAIQAHAGGMNWKSIVSSLPTLLLGLAAKDGDVTGVAK